MKTFKDMKNREWQISVNMESVNRVKEKTGINLLDNLGEAAISRLGIDPVRMFDLLFVLVKPQADAQGVTVEQFGESMDGSSIEAGGDALVEELIAFFKPSLRPAIKKAMEKIKVAETQAMAQAERQIDALDVSSLGALQ